MVNPMIKRLLADLFQDAQVRLDALKLKYPGHDEAIDAAYLEGFNFHWRRSSDIETAVQGNVTPTEYDTLYQEFLQHRPGLN